MATGLYATEANQDTIITRLTSILSATATAAKQDGIIAALGDLATSALQTSANALLTTLDATVTTISGKLTTDGNSGLRGQLSVGYLVPYVATTTDLETTFGSPCDCVVCPTDDYQIAYESSDGPDTYPGVNVTNTAPGLPVDDWTDNGDDTYTHGGAGAFTDALQWNSTLTVGSKVLVKYTVTGRSAGSVTASAGTTNGAATAADAAVREILDVAGNMTFALTPTADFDGTVSLIDVLPFSNALTAKEQTPLRCKRVECVVDDTGAEAATTVLHLGWYKKPSV